MRDARLGPMRLATCNILSGRTPGGSGVDVPRFADAMGATAYRFAPTMSRAPGQASATATDEDPPDGPAYGVAL